MKKGSKKKEREKRKEELASVREHVLWKGRCFSGGQGKMNCRSQVNCTYCRE